MSPGVVHNPLLSEETYLGHLSSSFHRWTMWVQRKVGGKGKAGLGGNSLQEKGEKQAVTSNDPRGSGVTLQTASDLVLTTTQGGWHCSVQYRSCVRLFVTPWTAACQASLSITKSQSLLNLMSIEQVMLSNHLVLWCPLLLLPSIFASIRVFSNELAFFISQSKYWSLFQQ